MRVAINGYGRIGRCVLRACCERRDAAALSVVAINELASPEAIAHLTTYDSTHGRFPLSVEGGKNRLLIDGESISLLQQEDCRSLPWRPLAVDLVMECTGKIGSTAAAMQHIEAGAGKVLLSHPGESDIPALVYGVNHCAPDNDSAVVSAASCTSNALIPVLSVLDNAFSIDNGVVTTIHASMHDQPVIDAYHSEDLRRNRAASQSIIPVDTSLSQGVGRVLPSLAEKISAHALRVPVNNVSALNITVNVAREVSVDEVNSAFREAAQCPPLGGILGYTEELLASCDFNHDARSSIVDAHQTRVSCGRTVNVLVWFDNEWAFANRMIDLALYFASSRAGSG